MVNYVMGFSFITEGAIPVAGALSMVFDCKSKAPHGGIFALLVGAVSNPLMYIIALIAGTFMGAFLLMISLNLGKKKEN